MFKLILAAALCLTFIGCGEIYYGPIKEVNAFIDAKNDVILQIAKKIEENPNEASVDEARKIFEARKADLIAKKEAINARPAGMNSDWRSTLAGSDINDTEYFKAIGSKAIKDSFEKNQYGWTAQAGEKFRALESDFKKAVSR